MRAVLWILVVVLLLLGAYLVYSARAIRSRQAPAQEGPVSAESVAVFQARLEQLRSHVAGLRVAIARVGPAQRASLERKLGLLDSRISDLSAAIEEWRLATGAPAQASLYHKCVLMYGKATGVCDVVAADTLPLGR